MCLKTIQISVVFSVLLLLCSCEWGWKSLGDASPDVVEVIRYDEMLEDYLHTDNVSAFLRMNTDYPRSTRIVVEDVLHLGCVDDEEIGEKLHAFYSDTTLLRLRHDVSEKFEDFSPYNRELQRAFAALHEVCPDVPLPRVFTFISAFRQSVVVGDGVVGIGLDKYMGQDYPLYKKYFYPCQRRALEPSRMTQDCLVYFLASQFIAEADPKTDDLLTAMLKWGKVQWAVAKMLRRPLLEEATACEKAHRWFKRHETEVWKVLSRPEVLHGHDMKAQASLLDFTTERSYFTAPESRGVGLWIGMRIVESFMEKHPEITIEQLLRMENYVELLKESDYRPA